MSSVATPRDPRSAYQRWELDSFDAPKKTGPAVVLPSASQLEHLRQQAHQQGYAAGYQEGSKQASAEAAQLQEIMAVLAQDLQRFDQGVADELLALALAISKQVLRQTIKLKPDIVLAVVNEVLGKLPLSHQRARLILHPKDAALVRNSLGERLTQSNWEIIESAEMARGGCRVEAPECEIDATIERRWQRVVEAVGSDDAWID